MSPTKPVFRGNSSQDPNGFRLFEIIVIYVVFVGATTASYYINPTIGTLMLMPGVLLLNKVRILPSIITMAVFIVGCGFLLSTNVDTFFILLMHTLFWLTIQMGGCLEFNVTSSSFPVDPEPVILLLLHMTLSAFMLGDPISTLALVITGVAAVHIFGDVEYPREKIIVVALSLGSTLFFRTFPAILCSAVLAAVIVVWRLRPLSPQTIALFGLFLLGLALLLDKTLGCGLVLVYTALVMALYVAAKVTSTSSIEQEPRRPPDKRFPNGFLPLSRTAESLDLHGHTVTGAMKVVHEYLRQREDEYREDRSQHLRHATIITGPGGNRYSNGEHDHANLIKPTVINFLKINKYRYESSSETPGLIKVDLESHAL